MPGLMKTNIKSLPFLHRGKVRDIYAVGDDKMLVVQTDRLSAFDVIMEDPIPGKGRILTAMSNFWFKKFGKLMPNHMTVSSLSHWSLRKSANRSEAGRSSSENSNLCLSRR